MTDHDRLFKELLTTFFLDFLELFLPQMAQYVDRSSFVFLDKEIFTDVTGGNVFEADLVVQVKFKADDSFFLIHIESQAKRQAQFGRRMFQYFARLYEKYAVPVYPVAVLSFDSPRTSQPSVHEICFPDRTVLHFEYAVIQLNCLDWRKFARIKNPVVAALMSRMRIAPEDREQVILECLRMLFTLRLDPARQRLISGFIGTYLQLTAQQMNLFKTRVATLSDAGEREVVMEVFTNWIEEGKKEGLKQGLAQGLTKGLEQGREQGLEQGRQEGAAVLVCRLLKQRFSQMPIALLDQVKQLSLEQLEALSEALLDFTSIAELNQWLSAHGR